MPGDVVVVVIVAVPNDLLLLFFWPGVRTSCTWPIFVWNLDEFAGNTCTRFKSTGTGTESNEMKTQTFEIKNKETKNGE